MKALAPYDRTLFDEHELGSPNESSEDLVLYSGREISRIFANGDLIKRIDKAIKARTKSQATNVPKPSYELDQRSITLEGGQVRFYLLKPIRFDLDPVSALITVLDWEISLPVQSIVELPGKIARKFLEFYSLAARDEIPENRIPQWIAISQYIDFTRYSSDIASPRYMEGTVVERALNRVTVKWATGEKENLKDQIADSLSDLQENDIFAAWVKLGPDERVSRVERVSLISFTPDAQL